MDNGQPLDDSSSSEQPSPAFSPGPATDWTCSLCSYNNHGGLLCSACRHPRAHFGEELGHVSSKRPRPPSSTIDIKDPYKLRAIYGHPFNHPYGPYNHRFNSNYKDGSYAPARTVVEFELSRLLGSVRHVVWIYPGPTGENLSTDERNRVRAYRIDHPNAYLN